MDRGKDGRTGRDGTGRDGTRRDRAGQDRTGRTGRDGTERDGTGRKRETDGAATVTGLESFIGGSGWTGLPPWHWPTDQMAVTNCEVDGTASDSQQPRSTASRNRC